MGYVDPKTDIVVAAGGDGTLFEVCYHDIRNFVYVYSTDGQRSYAKIRCG